MSIRRKNRGFTLVEMLVALAIFSLLITALLSGFHRGLAMWEQSAKKEQIWQTLLLRQQWLRSLFSQTLLGNYTKSQEDVYVPFFQGSARQLNIMTASPLLDNPGHTKPIQLKFELDIERHEYTLYYVEGEWHTDPDRDIHWNETRVPLLQHLKQGNFSYEAFAFPLPEMIEASTLSKYAKQRYREKTEWLNNYDAEQMWLFPRRVKIDFIDAQNVSHTWQFLFNSDVDVGNFGFIENDFF